MENENKILADLLDQLKSKLTDMLNCKSEIKAAENDALLFGKFALGEKRYTVVVHMAAEDFVPRTEGSAKIKKGDDYIQKGIMPSLKMPVLSASKGNCSIEESEAVKNKFLMKVKESFNNSKYAKLSN